MEKKVMKNQEKELKGEEGTRSRQEQRSGGRGRRAASLSADKRQKWMNPIGCSSLLSALLRELGTHFIEICEIRKAGYRVIDHRAAPAHTSSQLHNKSHN